MVREVGVAEHERCAAGGSEVGDLRRGLPEIGGHPDRAEAEAGEHGLEHLVAVAGLDEDAVAFRDAADGEGRGHGVHAGVHLRPGPGGVAPGEADLGGEAAGGLAQEVGQVHDPAGAGRDAARRVG